MKRAIKYYFFIIISALFVHFSNSNSKNCSFNFTRESESFQIFQLQENSLSNFSLLPVKVTNHVPFNERVKKLIVKFQLKIAESQIFVKPTLFSFYQFSVKQQLTSNFFKYILFPFHFFM